MFDPEVTEMDNEVNREDVQDVAQGDTSFGGTDYVERGRVFRSSWPIDYYTPSPRSVDILTKATAEFKRIPDLGIALNNRVVFRDFLDNLSSLREYCESESVR